MKYALIENGAVANVVWLHPANAQEFPNAVPMGDVPAAIGDAWDGGHFYRGGQRVQTAAQALEAELAAADAALLDLTYQHITGGLEE